MLEKAIRYYNDDSPLKSYPPCARWRELGFPRLLPARHTNLMQIFDRWLIAAGGLIALLLIAGGMTFQSTRRLNADAERVSHTHAVLTGLEEIISLAKDAETGQRGYVITGEEQYLEPLDNPGDSDLLPVLPLATCDDCNLFVRA